MINQSKPNMATIEVKRRSEELATSRTPTQIDPATFEKNQVDAAVLEDFIANVAVNLDLSTPKNSMAHAGWGVCYSD